MQRPSPIKLVGAAVGIAGAALAVDRLARTRFVRFARMAGSSIAGPDAAGWVTDFLNAAYYRRSPGLRDIDDLRLAFAIITTYWHRDEPPPVPPDATPILAFDLTTHAGHFMGASRNRLVLYEQNGQAYVRAAGTWDPMPWYVNEAYRRAGYEAQHAFWGMGRPEQSMLDQIALAVREDGAENDGYTR